MKIKCALIVSILALAALPDPSYAWKREGKWVSKVNTMRAHSGSFPLGAYRTSLATVVNRFNLNASQFRFIQQWGDPSVALDNGQSEVWFSSNQSILMGYDAVAYWYFAPGTTNLVETDVIFSNDAGYTTSMNKRSLLPFGGSLRPFETTAFHEYGHAAGLGHERYEYNIMGYDYTHIHCNGNTARSYLGEDAVDGLVSIYGRSAGVRNDVSVALYRFDFPLGEYSYHRLGRMFTTGGQVLPSTAASGQRRYNVSRGQAVKVEFTFENSSETSQTSNIGFYISGNRNITTSDRLIHVRTYSDSRGKARARKTTVTIPSDLTRGATYYLGAIIDYDNRIAETDEANNAAYHAIKIN